MFLLRLLRRFVAQDASSLTETTSRRTSKTASRKPSRRPARQSLQIESLEGRSLMATLIDAVPPALVAPALESNLIANSPSAIVHNSIAAPPQTVTITLQGTNDPPALSAPQRSNSPAPRLDLPTQMTVTITLQAVNDAPHAS